MLHESHPSLLLVFYHTTHFIHNSVHVLRHDTHTLLSHLYEPYTTVHVHNSNEDHTEIFFEIKELLKVSVTHVLVEVRRGALKGESQPTSPLSSVASQVSTLPEELGEDLKRDSLITLSSSDRKEMHWRAAV